MSGPKKYYPPTGFLILAIVLLISTTALGSATSVYVTQAGSGIKDGTSLTNALPISALSNAANCGAGSTQIGPGTTIYISVNTSGTGIANFPAGATMFTWPSSCSGAAGKPVLFQFKAGDIWQSPYWSNAGAMIFNGSSYIVVDGGGTQQYGSDGAIFRNSLNGTSGGQCPGGSCQYQQTTLVFATSPCNNCEFRNMVVADLYDHTSYNDVAVDGNMVRMINPQGSNFLIHDNTIHDCGWCINQNYTNDSNVRIYNNDIYRFNHGVACAGANYTVASEYIYNNHFHDMGNWASSTNRYHQDGVHCYNGSGGGIQNLYLYNNLFDGDMGTCCVTAWVYLEGAASAPWTRSTGKLTAWNNVFIGNAPSPQFSVNAGSGHEIYNNIFYVANNAGGVCVDGTGGQSGSTSTYRNNAFGGCNQMFKFDSAVASLVMDGNVYAQKGSGGNNSFEWSGHTSTNSFSTWQASCGCDANSQANMTATLGIDSLGVPQSGSLLAQFPGLNLSNSATGNLVSLASDTAAGGTHSPELRPTSGNWTSGAYQFGSGSATAPLSPSNLKAVVQ